MELQWLGKASEALGPVASVLFALVVLLIILYRRDHLLKALFLKEDRDQMIRLMERNAVAMERWTEQMGRTAEVTRDSAEKYTRQIEDLMQLTTNLRTRRRAR